MEVLSSALPNGFFNFSSLSSKSSRRFTSKRSQYQFSLPISKFPYYRASILRVSARFGKSSRRRNSLRKKIIGDENFRSNQTSYDPGTKSGNRNHNIDQTDELVELSSVEGLKDKVSQDSNLLNELEDWVSRYKKEAEYWGIGSNPIFTVYQDSVGNVEKVEVDTDEILSRGSGLEKLESASSRVLYAKKLAEQMENGEYVIHKDSSLVKFVSSSSSEEFRFVSSIQNAIRRLDLIPKLPAIGRAILCGYIGLWFLKTVLVYRKSNEVECTELEKEMMRRKMKAWKEKEMMGKGTVEVLQEEALETPLVSFEKPKFDRKDLLSSLSKLKGSETKLELLNSFQVETSESTDFDDKIHEIKAMAKRAREIEAGIELNEKEKRDVNKETGVDDEDMSMGSQNSHPHEDLADDDDDGKDESLGISSESDEENTELSGLAIPMVNGPMVDSGCSNHEMAASQAEKVSNGLPLVPADRIIQYSDVSEDKLSMVKNNTGRKSRVIRSVKEAKEFLSRSAAGKELTQTTAQNSDEIFLKQNEEELGVPSKSELADKNKTPSAFVNGTSKSALESNISEPLGKDADSQSQKNDYQKISEPRNAVKGLSKQRDYLNEKEERKSSLLEPAKSSSEGAEHIEKEQPSGKENWIEKNYHEFEPVVEKMRAGFRNNYMAAREKDTQEPGTIAEIAEIYHNGDNDELEWMKDEHLRDIVFRVRDNELAGRDPFHLIGAEDKAMFLQGLEKKVEKENEKLSHLHQWIHSNIENIDYGLDGISVYDPPEKVIPRWKGPSLEKNPEFLDKYHGQREALFSGKAVSVSPVKKEEQTSLQESSQSASSEKTFTSQSETTLSQPKIVVEGSDGSVRPGKKSGKEYWQHTKKWSRGYLELYNAETDPEVKAVMKDMGKDLDRWITEDEIKDAASIMEKLPEKNKKFMEKKLNKLKREMELFGPQAVLSKYREYGEDKPEDYLWWLDLPHVLCLELYTVDDKGEQQVGFYTLEMAKDLELEPKPHHVIPFEDASDCRQLCYIIQAHLDMLRTGNVFIVPRPPKDAFREAKSNGFGVTIIRKGELKLNIDEPLEEVEERICEIGSKMYHDKIMGDRSVDISSLMKGVFNLKTKPTRRMKKSKSVLKNPNKKSS